jgi:acyl carrier protein phosphodiesterase
MPAAKYPQKSILLSAFYSRKVVKMFDAVPNLKQKIKFNSQIEARAPIYLDTFFSSVFPRNDIRTKHEV